jgi:hypothetical protein
MAAPAAASYTPPGVRVGPWQETPERPRAAGGAARRAREPPYFSESFRVGLGLSRKPRPARDSDAAGAQNRVQMPSETVVRVVTGTY